MFFTRIDHEKPPIDSLRHLRTVHDEVELSLLRGLLEDAKIPLFVRDHNPSACLRVTSGFAVFGADVFVDKSDYDRARELADVYLPEDGKAAENADSAADSGDCCTGAADTDTDNADGDAATADADDTAENAEPDGDPAKSAGEAGLPRRPSGLILALAVLLLAAAVAALLLGGFSA